MGSKTVNKTPFNLTKKVNTVFTRSSINYILYNIANLQHSTTFYDLPGISYNDKEFLESVVLDTTLLLCVYLESILNSVIWLNFLFCSKASCFTAPSMCWSRTGMWGSSSCVPRVSAPDKHQDVKMIKMKKRKIRSNNSFFIKVFTASWKIYSISKSLRSSRLMDTSRRDQV